MSKNFDKIQKWYAAGIYTAQQVQKLYEKGQITNEELNTILNK